MFEIDTFDGNGRMEDLVVKKLPELFLHFTPKIIFALNRIIQVLVSLEYTIFKIIPKSLVTLQFLKFLIVQIKAYIQGFEMSYQSFLGHWYPNGYS